MTNSATEIQNLTNILKEAGIIVEPETNESPNSNDYVDSEKDNVSGDEVTDTTANDTSKETTDGTEETTENTTEGTSEGTEEGGAASE